MVYFWFRLRPFFTVRSAGLGSMCSRPFHARLTRWATTSSFPGLRTLSYRCLVNPTVSTEFERCLNRVAIGCKSEEMQPAVLYVSVPALVRVAR